MLDDITAFSPYPLPDGKPDAGLQHMKLSPSVRYAVRLLFELYQAGASMPLSALSEKTGISLRAVEKVHTTLKQHGVTDGAVGAKGGITLVRSLQYVSLGELIAWLDDGVVFEVCCGEKAYECPHKTACQTRTTWQGVSSKVQQVLNSIPLENILRQYAGPTTPSGEDAF